MRIVELKSQITKIIYKPSQEEIKVGDFISLIENDLTIIAQVYKILSSDVADDFNQVDLMFVLTHKYDKTNVWRGETVSADALVEKTPLKLIENYISNVEMESPFIIGKSLSYGMPLAFDFANFQSPAFIGYENVDDSTGLLDNLASVFSALGKSFIVLDYKGNIEIPNAKKILAGVQFKLPLNTSMIEKLSSKILEGLSLESKVMIEDVLAELAQYAEQSSGGFIPISSLIQTIDNFYKKSKLAPLILLKNKLSYYRRLNIFADTMQELTALACAVEENNIVIFDLSNIHQEWQNEFLFNIVGPDKTLNKDFYMYLTIDNKNYDNGIMNYLLFKAVANGVHPIISANYRHLAFDSIFDFSKNMFLFKTYNALKKRAVLSDILQTLPSGCFIVNGKLTANTILTFSLDNPFVISPVSSELIAETINEAQGLNALNNAIGNESDFSAERIVEDIIEDTLDYEAVSESLTQPEPQEIIEEAPLMNNAIISDLDVQQASKIGIPIEPGIVKKENEVIEIQMPEVETQPEEPLEENEILELVGLDDEITDDLFEEVMPADDELEDMADLDFLNESDEPVQPQPQDDNDEELFDLIDEGPAPVQDNLPVYDAANYTQNTSDEGFATNLQEGDLVKHNKYGIGTIKKITTHGEKVLCHINFDNFGRRLLDPEISQLQKLN